jgi:transposase
MTALAVTTPPTAAHDETVRCLFAIELSKKSWVVGYSTALSTKFGRSTLAPGDGKGLLQLIAQVRDRVQREVCCPVEVITCYEAGYDGFWLHRLLEAHAIRNYVIDPASMQVDRRARRAKTDRIDAERMLRSLAGYLRGDPKVWSVVQVPSIGEEDARRLHRERDRLIKERVQHVNRIKALVAIHGVYNYDPLRRDRLQRLKSLRTVQGQPLPPALLGELTRELQRLELALKMLATVEAQRDAIVQEERSAHPHARKIRELYRLRSIGAEIATSLIGEVLYRSFNNRRQVGSYVGFSGSPFNSGPMVRDQGISKAGNPKARKTMIELAWLWLRYQPDSALSIWFKKRVGNAKGRIKRIMIVAMARKLLVALWRYLETGVIPHGAVLKG